MEYFSLSSPKNRYDKLGIIVEKRNNLRGTRIIEVTALFNISVTITFHDVSYDDIILSAGDKMIVVEHNSNNELIYNATKNGLPVHNRERYKRNELDVVRRESVAWDFYNPEEYFVYDVRTQRDGLDSKTSFYIFKNNGSTLGRTYNNIPSINQLKYKDSKIFKLIEYVAKRYGATKAEFSYKNQVLYFTLYKHDAILFEVVKETNAPYRVINPQHYDEVLELIAGKLPNLELVALLMQCATSIRYLEDDYIDCLLRIN